MSALIFIVEDHAVMRQMLAAYLTDQTSYDVCGQAASAEAALEQLAEAAPDLVLVDVSLPGMSGIELVRQIQTQRDELACLMISGHGEPEYVRRALGAGARGYVVKGNPYELPGAIEEVLSGATYLSPSVRAA